MEAVLLIGIQGSGKTTFYRERFFETHVRVSRDMVKTRPRERLLVGKRLEPPSLAEGFDALHVVEVDAAGGFTVREWCEGAEGSAGSSPPPRPRGGAPRE